MYPVGSKVWLKNMSKTHRMGGKLDDAYLGPYTVAEVVDKGCYQLQNESGKKLKKLYNGVLLKEYFPVKGSTESQLDVKVLENNTEPSNREKPEEESSKPCMQTRLGGKKTTAKQLFITTN